MNNLITILIVLSINDRLQVLFNILTLIEKIDCGAIVAQLTPGFNDVCWIGLCQHEYHV